MAIRFVLFLSTAILIYLAIVLQDFQYVGWLIFTFIVIISVLAYNKITKVSRYEELIKKVKRRPDDFSIKPFLNVNKEPAYVLELIPGVPKSIALKIENQRKNNKIKFYSFEEFAVCCQLPLQYHNIVKRIVKF